MAGVLGPDPSLTEWVDTWRRGRSGVKVRTTESLEAHIRLHILPHLGHLTLREMSVVGLIGEWVTMLDVDKGLAPKTVRNIHGNLSMILAAAVKAGLLAENPCADTRLPRGVHTEMCFLTETQYERLEAATSPRWRPLLRTAIGTGMRWGELMGLLVGRVDLLAGQLHVVESLHEPDAGPMVLGTPKSRAARRTVRLPASVVDVLVPLVAGRASTEHVFVTMAGVPPRRANWRKQVWVPALRRSGLAEEFAPRVPRFHDLRHSHVSWLIAAGVPLPAISRRVGHESITTTVDRYGHLLPELDTVVLAGLDRALGDAPGADWTQDGRKTKAPDLKPQVRGLRSGGGSGI